MPDSDAGESPAIVNKTAGRVDESGVARLAARVLAAENTQDAGELTITFVEPAEMASLNERFRKRQGPTDVLSFAMTGGRETPGFKPPVKVLGDVIVCPDYIGELAAGDRADPDERMAEALVHGILHLLGYEHSTAGGKKRMLERQRSILKDGE